jgi:hypothetical protein
LRRSMQISVHAGVERCVGEALECSGTHRISSGILTS